MSRSPFRHFMPVLLLFLILNALAIIGRQVLESWGVSQSVLIGGNGLLFVVTLLSFFLTIRTLSHPNPNRFVQGMYAGMLIKLFLFAGAALVYIALNKKSLNKPALFICMGLYLVYTFLEASVLMRLLKRGANV